MTDARERVVRSIRDRLLTMARQANLPFNQVFTLYALERLLYRIGASPYRRQFVLKGGLLLRADLSPCLAPFSSWISRGTCGSSVELLGA